MGSAEISGASSMAIEWEQGVWGPDLGSLGAAFSCHAAFLRLSAPFSRRYDWLDDRPLHGNKRKTGQYKQNATEAIIHDLGDKTGLLFGNLGNSRYHILSGKYCKQVR